MVPFRQKKGGGFHNFSFAGKKMYHRQLRRCKKASGVYAEPAVYETIKTVNTRLDCKIALRLEAAIKSRMLYEGFNFRIKYAELFASLDNSMGGRMAQSVTLTVIGKMFYNIISKS